MSLPSGDTGDSQIELVSTCWEPIRRYRDRLEGWGIRRPTRVKKTGSAPKDLWSPQLMKEERDDRLLQEICCRNKIGELNWRTRRLKITYLTPLPVWPVSFQGEHLGCWWVKGRGWRRKAIGEALLSPFGMRAERKKNPSIWSSTIWNLRKGRRAKTYLLTWLVWSVGFQWDLWQVILIVNWAQFGITMKTKTAKKKKHKHFWICLLEYFQNGLTKKRRWTLKVSWYHCMCWPWTE